MLINSGRPLSSGWCSPVSTTVGGQSPARLAFDKRSAREPSSAATIATEVTLARGMKTKHITRRRKRSSTYDDRRKVLQIG